VSSKDEEIRLERANAWIGDAVLALFARQYVLRERNMMDGEWFTRMTSNEFLSAFGNPTRVEASIGKLFLEGGLEAAVVPPADRQTALTLPKVASEKAGELVQRSGSKQNVDLSFVHPPCDGPWAIL
jgi:hypothetical protein